MTARGTMIAYRTDRGTAKNTFFATEVLKMKAAVIRKFGGPEVLRYEDVKLLVQGRATS